MNVSSEDQSLDGLEQGVGRSTTSINGEQGLRLLPNQAQPTPRKKTGRVYWVDWTRSIAIHLVIVVHCVNDTSMALDYSK